MCPLWCSCGGGGGGRVNDAGGSDKTWATRILFSDLAGSESESCGVEV